MKLFGSFSWMRVGMVLIERASQVVETTHGSDNGFETVCSIVIRLVRQEMTHGGNFKQGVE